MAVWKWIVGTAATWTLAGIWIRLLFSLAVGMFIGIDRGLKRRGAGIKTHVLVCLGATLVMLTSEYMFRTFPDAKADMARLGAQVISGVGFLGVGTIMVTGRNQVRGLTTAACLWISACEGLAAGIGFVEGAAYGLVLIALTLKLLTKVDAMIHNHAKVFDFYLEFNTSSGVGTFMDTMRTKDIRIVSFDIAKSRLKGEGPSATMSIEVQDKHAEKDLAQQYPGNGRDKICRRIIGSINTMEDHRMNGNRYDVVIIGGGVIGSSIARALSKYQCRTVLLEKEEDVAPALPRRTARSFMPVMTQKQDH